MHQQGRANCENGSVVQEQTLRGTWSRGSVVWRGAASLIVTLIAIRKSVHVRVVEKGFGAVSPRETLQKSKQVSQQNLFWHRLGLTGSDLAANAKVRVGDKLGLLVAVTLLLQEGVQHAHPYAGQGDHKGQDLPCLCCRKRKNKVLINKWPQQRFRISRCLKTSNMLQLQFWQEWAREITLPWGGEA